MIEHIISGPNDIMGVPLLNFMPNRMIGGNHDGSGPFAHMVEPTDCVPIGLLNGTSQYDHLFRRDKTEAINEDIPYTEISDEIFDKMIDLVSYGKSGHTTHSTTNKNKTSKSRSKECKSSKNITKKIRSWFLS